TRAHARAEAGELAGAAEDFSRVIAVQPELAQQCRDRATVYERPGGPSLAGQDRAAVSRLQRPAEGGAAPDCGRRERLHDSTSAWPHIREPRAGPGGIGG